MTRWIVLVASIAGCYKEPRPACGFVCGEGGDCPSGYTCNAADNRCHLDGTSVDCDSYVDAGPDAPPDADTTPPEALVMAPGPGVTDVSPTAIVVVRFSEDVIHLDPMTGWRLDWVGGFIPGAVAPTGAPFTEQYTPAAPLPDGATITVTLTSAVTDLAGNPLPETTWMFTVAPDAIAPTVTSTTPANGDTNVATDVVIQVMFSEAIQFTPSSITVDQGVTGTVAGGPFAITFTPSAALAGATTYTATVATDVTDLSGNHLAAPVTFSFTTM